MPRQAQKADWPQDEGLGSPEEKRALDDIFSLVYEELRRLASYIRKNELHSTLNSTALVHEAWLKLKDSPLLASNSAPHFKAVAAKAMRQVLVDEARRRGARKRGGSGEAVVVALGESTTRDDMIFAQAAGGSSVFGGFNSMATASSDGELLALDSTLKELHNLNPRQAKIVEGRFFGGLNVSETAAVLGVSESVVERDWRAAKAWLAGRIRPQAESTNG